MQFAKRSLIGILGLSLMWAVQPAGAQVEFSQDLYAKLAQCTNPIPEIAIPSYQRVVLNNGLVLYLAENHDLPIFAINGLVRCGRGVETLKNAGISDLMLQEIENQIYGGEIGGYYKIRGIRVDCKLKDDHFAFTSDALSSEKDALLSMVYEMLCNVDFSKLDWQKEEWKESLKQKAEDESSLLLKYFDQNIFKDHPYSFENDYTLALSNLARQKPKNLQQHYRQFFSPANTVLFIYGDFNRAEIVKKVGRFYTDVSAKEQTFSTVNVVDNPDYYGKVILVDKADAKQARIMMGYSLATDAFLEQNLDARTAFEIGNQVLGSGDFGSRLMDEIRTNKGYVYDIDAQYEHKRLGSAFRITTSVKSERSCETVAAIKQTLQAIKSGERKVTAAEVFRVVNHMNAFYPEQYRDQQEIVNNLVYNLEIKQRDADYLKQYIASYNKVTAASAQAALERWLFPEKMLTVIVGKKEDILPSFQKANLAVTVVGPK